MSWRSACCSSAGPIRAQLPGARGTMLYSALEAWSQGAIPRFSKPCRHVLRLRVRPTNSGSGIALGKPRHRRIDEGAAPPLGSRRIGPNRVKAAPRVTPLRGPYSGHWRSSVR